MVAVDTAPNFLKTVLSTITSPLPLDVVIIYRETCIDRGVCNWLKPVRVEYVPAPMRAENALRHQQRFEAIREMYGVREFRLVLCADVLDCIAKDAIRVLECIAKAEKAKGGLVYLPYEPLIVSGTRSPRTRLDDHRVGWTGRWAIVASAL
jgi:hypothetical protein